MSIFGPTWSKAMRPGVTDARACHQSPYDAIYTERYMYAPQLDTDGREHPSVPQSAEGSYGDTYPDSDRGEPG